MDGKVVRKIQERWVAIALSVILGLVLSVVAFSGVAAFSVAKFRSKPTYAFAHRCFNGYWPHLLIARFLIVKEGAPQYHTQLRTWLFDERGAADDFLNRALLSSELLRALRSSDSLSDDEEELLKEQLSGYLFPLSAAAEAEVLKMLKSSRSVALPLVGKLRKHEVLAALKSQIEGPDATPGGTEYALSALVSGGDSLVESDEFPAYSVFSSALGHEHSGALELLASASDKPYDALVAMQVAVVEQLKKRSRASPEESQALGTIIGRLVRKAGPGSDIEKALIAEADLLLLEEWAAAGVALYTKDDRQQLTALFEALIAPHESEAVALLHGLAHRDPAIAEMVSRKVLATGDSTARKSVIVLLSNHGAPAGMAKLDEAFAGKAPRVIPFSRVAVYSGSGMVKKYLKLAGHDYQETGKTWPPSGVSGLAFTEEVVQWKRLIAKAPWAPFYDDAMYRFGYLQWAKHDVVGALETLNQYLQTAIARSAVRTSVKAPLLPDADCHEYVMYLLANAVRSSPEADGPEIVAAARGLFMRTLSELLLDDEPQVDNFLAALEWMRANSQRSMLLATVDDLTGSTFDLNALVTDMQALAKAARSFETTERLYLTADFLAKRGYLKRPDKLTRLLFGMSIRPNSPKGQLSHLPLPPLKDAYSIERIAGQVAERLAELRKAATENRTAVVLTLWGAIYSAMLTVEEGLPFGSDKLKFGSVSVKGLSNSELEIVKRVGETISAQREAGS